MKLPPYDLETGRQPTLGFDCHQQNGHLCAGWVGCHDMNENLALRVAIVSGELTPEEYEQILNYESPVPLFASGADAAQHGLEEAVPGPRAQKIIDKLKRKGLASE